MPGRLLRAGLRTSTRWNATNYSAQSLYIALMNIVDDYGRYDARPILLHGECRYLRAQSASDLPASCQRVVSELPAGWQLVGCNVSQTDADLHELNDRGLIQLYSVKGQEYLQILNWQERRRGKMHYPAPGASELPASREQVVGELPASRGQVADKILPFSDTNTFPDSFTNTLTNSEGNGCIDLIQHSEMQKAARIIGTAHFKENFGALGWSSEYDALLDENLPIPRGQFDALVWLYALPQNDPMFNNPSHPAFTKRRQTFVAFMKNLRQEAQKALDLRERIFAVTEPEVVPAWPPGMKAAFSEKWPGRRVPETWGELPESDRALLIKIK